MLEFLDGPHLSTLLRDYDVSLDQALSLGVQLCSAVHYMGTRDVVHLDIKPRNVIMAGPPRLIDFSLALRTGELAGLSSPVGTPKYMAPEQCDPGRLHDLGEATDVWGIGVTLYWALAKGSPFPPCSSVSMRPSSSATRSSRTSPHRSQARCPRRWPRSSGPCSRRVRSIARRRRGSWRNWSQSPPSSRVRNSAVSA